MNKEKWIWSILTLLILILTAFTSSSDQDRRIKSLVFEISDPANHYLVNSDDLYRYLYSYMDTVDGYKASVIELYTIETILEGNSHVGNAEAFIDRQSKVRVQVDLKEPILRVLSNDSRGYYVTEDADIVEWSPNYTPRLIVASGNVPKYEHQDSLSVEDQNSLNALSYLVSEINKMSYLQSIVDEIIYNGENNIELVSKIGEARVLIGDTTDLVEKLERFSLFHTEAYPIVGWDKYKVIDVRFKDKVYCRK